jgi:hypothetical protein
MLIGGGRRAVGRRLQPSGEAFRPRRRMARADDAEAGPARWPFGPWLVGARGRHGRNASSKAAGRPRVEWPPIDQATKSFVRCLSDMALNDIPGVFSKYFVVGFFLPAFVAVFSLWLAASSAFVPNALDQYSQPTELLILGGVALVAGLALSGVSYYVTRFFEGYPLERLSRWPVARLVDRGALALQRRRYDRLLAIRRDKSRPDKDRIRALSHLDRFYPRREALLPTRLGNAIRAFERHSNKRWGLDGVTIWPRIEALLSADERELLEDSKINVYVFLNAAAGALVVGAFLVVDQAVNTPQPASFWPLYAVPFALAYVLYRLAVAPAADWGDYVRSSIDLHRLEIYEKLGVRRPASFTDERELAVKVNQMLLYGRPLLSDDLWRPEQAGNEKAKAGSVPTLVVALRRARGKERDM